MAWCPDKPAVNTCPLLPGKRYEDQELDHPARKTLEEIRPIRDEIRDRANTLLDGLASAYGRRGGQSDTHGRSRAEFVLTERRPAGHLPAGTARTSTSFTIFEGTSEIQRVIIGRAVTGLDVR
jgi:hypothetical protein